MTSRRVIATLRCIHTVPPLPRGHVGRGAATKLIFAAQMVYSEPLPRQPSRMKVDPSGMHAVAVEQLISSGQSRTARPAASPPSSP